MQFEICGAHITHVKPCLKITIFLLESRIVKLKLCINSLESRILLDNSLPVFSQLFDGALHIISLSFLLVSGCLSCNSIL